MYLHVVVLVDPAGDRIGDVAPIEGACTGAVPALASQDAFTF